MTLAQEHSVNDKTPTSFHVEPGGNSAPRRSIQFSKRYSFLSSWARPRCAIPVLSDIWGREVESGTATTLMKWHCQLYLTICVALWFDKSQAFGLSANFSKISKPPSQHVWVETLLGPGQHNEPGLRETALSIPACCLCSSLTAPWAMEGVTSRHRWMSVATPFANSLKMREVFEDFEASWNMLELS